MAIAQHTLGAHQQRPCSAATPHNCCWQESCHRPSLSLERCESQATLSPEGSPVYDGRKPQDNQSEEDDDARRKAEENDGDAANVPVELGEEATKEQPPQADAYDLWRGWSTHSFGDRSSSIDSADPSHEWRNLRSLSIDGLEDQNEALPLDSLANSLRSLRIGHSDDGVIRAAATPHAAPPFNNRPRSYSDYTSALGSHANDRSSWHETIGVNALTATLDNQQHYLEAHAPTALPKDTVNDLWKALKTNFATRHVLVKSSTMHFDVDDVQRLSDMMHNYGSVARIRSELASEGLLLFTFFELRSAITAVKTQNTDQATSSPTSSPLFSPARTSSRGEMIHFALPYESPDDVNSATVLVTLEQNNNETSVTPTTMRQFCSHFGEVASVMQLEAHTRNKFLVEFNDSRVVSLALHGLSSNGCKSISVVRAASSTLDVSKIQRFQECVEQLSVLGPMRSLKPRPKSFSSSSTSILTSPTSSVASSLNASFMEGPPSSSSTSTLVGSDHLNSDSPTLDPTTPPGFTVRPATDERIWSHSIGGGRVRSSSMYTQLSSSRGDYKDAAAAAADRFEAMGASMGRNSFPMSSSQVTCATYPPSSRSGSSRFSNEAGFDDDISGSELNEFAHQYQPDSLPSSRVRVDPMMSASSFMSATKFVPPNQYHEQYRPTTHPPANLYGYHQYGSENASGRSPPGQGRHDQGTGEFCLSIERVASGEDTRTTLMIRNIPNKYTQQMLLTEINQHHRGQYDFFYLPIDFKNKCNMGYAFINFIEARSIVSFYREFDGQKWTNFNSEKVCAISYARLQGKQAMIARFQNSSLLEKHESYRPLVFVSSGPNRGRPEHFPAPKLPSNGSFRKQSSPSQSFYSNTPPNYYQQHNQHSRHEEQYLPGMASARTYGISSAASMLTHQNSQFNPYQSSQYYSHQQQASLLVVDPHQAQAILAAQMAAVAAIAPPRSSFRSFSQHESVRYQHPLHQYHQQQMQQRSSAYDLSERHQSGGYGSRSRYSS